MWLLHSDQENAQGNSKDLVEDGIKNDEEFLIRAQS